MFVMTKKILGIATINLVEEEGVQRIEIIPDGDFNLVALFETIVRLNQNSPISKPKDLGSYLEYLLADLKLPITIYRQNAYQGIRSNIDNTTLIYWNYNSRSNYLNISPKSEILSPLIEKLKFQVEGGHQPNENGYGPHYEPEDKFIVFWRQDSKYQFKKKLVSIFQDYAKIDKFVSKQLLKHNKNALEKGDLNSLKTSLNPEWWKEYDTWKTYFEDPDDYVDESFITPWGEEYTNKLEFLENYPVDPFLDMKPIMNKMFEERFAIPIDEDKRFPRTQRIRLISEEEVDEFFIYLAPQLERIFQNKIQA
jgi:hypothetical protein